MGRKVHPVAFRLGIIKDWQSRWYADRDYSVLLHEDVRIRQMVGQRLTGAALSKVEIQRSANQIEVTLHTAKPGIVIGKGGQAVDVLRKELETSTGKKAKINIEEVKQPELNAYLIAESIAEQLSRRVSYRRAMKQAVMRAQRAGAKGVKVRISGRLGGSEMARSVWEREGRVPLHTIRADIDYGQVHAHTTYGRIGVKVWIYKGDVIQHKGGDALLQQDRPAAVAQPRPERPRREQRNEGDNRGENRGDSRGARGGGDRREGGPGGGRGQAPAIRGGSAPPGGAARMPGAPRPNRSAPVAQPQEQAPEQAPDVVAQPSPETTGATGATNEGGAE